MADFVKAATTTEIEPGQARLVEVNGKQIALFNVGGQFYVTDDHCTHGPGSLSEGYLEGDVIECNFHQGCFNVRTGEVVVPPCFVPIKTYKTVVENGVVYIEIAEVTPASSGSDPMPS